ncbi:DUF2225 domain-containing protein [Brevibacillus dissolubilis]|uniref:DUF2225 domain-containing protein n=1 Tax=Brevibacillus dissolubilis TaxID=1844116 RepID=UPI001115E0BB|nr:DUF2225 domain-containing protein [Brevibacillus dissolubilis]
MDASNGLSVLFDKNYTCYHCDCNFTSKKVRSRFQVSAKRDTDFCTHYQKQEYNPILYTVNICPTCGFSFTEQFRQPMLKEHKQIVKESITSRWTAKNFGQNRSYAEAIATYKLAIYAAELTKEAHSVKAGLYLRLAWLYRFQKKDAEEKRFLSIAVREYEESFVHSDYKKGDKEMSEVKILYLIGELFRRIGEYDKAINYFGKVIQRKNQTIEHGIVTMARDQWSVAREEHAAKKEEEKLAEAQLAAEAQSDAPSSLTS